MALLSKWTYVNNDPFPAELAEKGWQPVVDGLRNNNETGFRARLYVNVSGAAILAFAGTTPGDIPDALTNLAQGLGYINSQYTDAIRFAGDCKA